MALKLKDFFPINKGVNISSKLKQNFVFALLKLILNFFSDEAKLPLIPKVGPSLSTKNDSYDCQHEMISYYQHRKLQNF